MALFCPLFSGSSGNSTYIGSLSEGILIDAGVSAKKILTALEANDIPSSAVKAIFITHEHDDHINGLRVLSKKLDVPIFSSFETKTAVEKKIGFQNREIIAFESTVEIGSMTVQRYNTSHDCDGSSCYTVVTYDKKRIAVCTDLGYVSDEIHNALCGCDLVMLESNHDIGMLQNGVYTFQLKKRILSEKGHLSNNSCADELVKLYKSGTKRFVLAHISKENNLPIIALETARCAFSLEGLEQNVDYILEAAPRSDGKIMVV